MTTASPYISVIIPTYQRPNQLQLCLQALTSLDYSTDNFEVIIVNDDIQDLTPLIHDTVKDKLNFLVLNQPHAGPATARNFGASKAKSQYLLFLDDDCTPEMDFLGKVAIRCKEFPASAIGGKILNAVPENLYAEATHLVISFLYDHYNKDPEDAHFFTVECLAVPTSHFRVLQGFNAAFRTGEDREFCQRWRQAGYQMIYAPEIIVHHSHAEGIMEFCRQHYSYGRCSCRFRFQTPGIREEEKKLESTKFYIDLQLYPFSKGKGLRTILLFLLILLSQTANAIGFCTERLFLNLKASWNKGLKWYESTLKRNSENL